MLVGRASPIPKVAAPEGPHGGLNVRLAHCCISCSTLCLVD